MKKLFVSVPMNGRKEEDISLSIQKMKKIAEIYWGEELQLLDTFFCPDEICNIDIKSGGDKGAIYSLCLAIMKMAEADYFIGCAGWPFFRGCEIESQIARDYKMELAEIPTKLILTKEEVEKIRISEDPSCTW